MNSTITVYINSNVNEIFGKIDMKQTFKNYKDNPIELSIEIPIIKGMYLNQIKCKFNNKEYFSKIYPKEKAEEKYTDALSEGNNAIYCKYDPENTSYILDIGYLEPNSEIEFESTFYYLVNSSNNLYTFSLYKIYPSQYDSKKLFISAFDTTHRYCDYSYNNGNCKCNICSKRNKRLKANINVKTISKIENINSSYIDKDWEKIFFKFQSENEVNINYLKINSKITASSDSDNKFIDSKQEKENNERILINFSTKENNKENILFYQFDEQINKVTYLLRLPKNENKENKLENIFKKRNDDNCLYFMIDKKEINYIYYCFIVPNGFSYKEIINEEINYKEHQLENGNGLNKALMSVYLNENNIERVNEFKLAKEYQILSKNSCLFLKTENENIITNRNIESYTYSRKNNENTVYPEEDWVFDFFTGNKQSVNKEDENENNDKYENENYDKYENNNCITRKISNKYPFLQKYLLKNEWYDEEPKKFCEKCNLGLETNRAHIINECSFYSKWRDESIDKIKKIYKDNELVLEIDDKNLEELLDDLFYQMNNIDERMYNDIYEILDFIISGFKKV